MPSVVYCDNKDCLFYDDCRGCDVDRLVIERGVCIGSTLHGRNASENDLDEQLKAENAKLRELCKDMFRDFVNCDFTLREGCGRTFMAVTRYEPRMRELGIEAVR